MGMGKQPAEISIQSPAFRSVSTQSEQAIGVAADALGIHIDRIDHVIKTATSPNDVTLDCTTLPAGLLWVKFFPGLGTTAASRCSSSKNSGPAPPISPVGTWTLEAHTLRVRIDGIPNIDAEVCVDTGPVAHFNNMSGGFVAVGISAIQAIPYVLKAPRVVVMPEVFGAYRWPGAAALT